jgi:hypothetical protein
LSADAVIAGQCDSGLPDFSCYNVPKRGKMYQVTTKYFGIFGSKIWHLAILFLAAFL